VKIKIISDGSSDGTKVVNEQGEEVEGVMSIFWAVSGEEKKSVAMITIQHVEAEITIDDYKDNTITQSDAPAKKYSELFEERFKGFKID
jgi:hypothetical protein